MSDRGIPVSPMHMNGYGSHTLSLWDAAGERYWVKFHFKTEQGHGPAFWITSIVAQLVLGILASIIVMWFSRQREYRADAGGATLAGRQNMIAALERLRAGQPNHLPDELVAFGINNKAHDAFTKLFMTHPPLTDRIARLKEAR